MSQREWIKKDYYATLGVRPSVSAAEIKKAYRKLAQRYHPDANAGDKQAEGRFKEISQAYDVLSDPKQRKDYDQFREMMRSGWGPFGRGGRTVRVERFEDLGDIFGEAGGFESIFERFFGQSARGAPRGPDLETEVKLSLEQALEGTSVELPLDDPTTGARRTVKARIPAGVKDGGRIRLAGKGGSSPGGARGDLYVRVSVAPHKVFGSRDGDITVKVPITFVEAALGAEVEVPTLNAKNVRLKIPAGTPSGKTFRVKGKGPSVNGRQRDLLVTVDVAVPTRLSGKAKELLKQFAQLNKDDPRDHLKT